MGAILSEIALPEIEDFVSVRKNVKTAIRSVGRQTLSKNLGNCGRKKTPRRTIPAKSMEKPVAREKMFYRKSPLTVSNTFRYQLLVAVLGNLEANVPVADDVLASHETKSDSTDSLDENCNESEFQTDQKYCIELRQTKLTLKLKFVTGQFCET